MAKRTENLELSWKKTEKKKAEKAVAEEDSIVLYLLTMDNNKKEEIKKVIFADNAKKPMEAGMLCTIDRETFISSWSIHGLVTLEPCAILPLMMQIFMMSLISISCYREV